MSVAMKFAYTDPGYCRVYWKRERQLYCLPLKFADLFASMMGEAARDLMEGEDEETEDATPPSEDKQTEQSAA